MNEYLNFDDQQIEKLALLTNLANSVLNYIASQPWSRKRKDSFINAYTDIMQRGIIGASNSTGLIEVNGSDLNLDLKSKMDLEMYKAVAYFILRQMSRLPTRTKETSNKNESKLNEVPTFKTEEFISDLKKNISGDLFGIFDFDLSRWNNLDKERSELTGERFRNKRTEVLRKHLEEFNNNLSENQYNFAESPFKTFGNFKERLSKAIDALKTPEIEDDEEALNRIGIRLSEWFDTGLLDKFVNEKGEEVTYALLALLNELVRKLQEELKRKRGESKSQLEEAAKSLQNISKFKSVYSYTTNQAFKWRVRDFYKYDNIQSILELYNYVKEHYSSITSNKDFSKHSAKILGAYVILNDNNKLKPLTNSIWSLLKNTNTYKSRSLNEFKFLTEIGNIVLDTKNNKIIFLDENELKKNTKDVFLEFKNRPSAMTLYPLKMYTPLRKLGGKITDLQIDKFLKQYK